jgi:hypothetical protein
MRMIIRSIAPFSTGRGLKLSCPLLVKNLADT